MKLPHYKRSARLSSSQALFVATGLLILASLVFSGVATAMRSTGVAAAWERAREAGAYRFSADVRQTTTPLSTVRNVGRASKTQTLHLEGETNLPDRALHLTLWSQGGSVLTGAGGVEIKVEGDRAYARQGGQDWQEINNFTGLFAPQGDFMAYLSAAKNVRRETADGRPGLSRFTFDIDGPAYAAYLRDQIEKQLAASGELPPGVTLDVPKQYVDMTGDGELWLDANGYPRRQILHLYFPSTPDSQMISAEVTVDFDFSVPGAADLTSPVARFVAHLPRIADYGSRLALVIALCAMLVIHSRSRKLYAVLAVFLVAATIFTPLLQSVQAAGFIEKQVARQREAEARQQGSDMQRALSAFLGESDHDPHLDPLAANQQVGESVNHESYFTDYATRNTDYATLATSATSDNSDNDDNASNCDPDNPADTDGDGLTDGNECVLGTNPEADDTDGDGISDGDEVRGFDYNGQTWYTDPLALDTNNDGLGDGQEWNAGRAEGGPPPDLDGDGTPDLFDRDNDGDGVPDKLDLSPYYKSDATFTADDPFELIVDDLEPGVPTFVEFQLRPTNPDHLWYAFNVLDWPKGDLRGQIQDKDGATFYDVDGDTDRNPNDNGDIKLVPMLEIRITGSPDNLPPENDLKPYGIFVQELNNDDDKVVYVPLQLITERTGEEHVAFSGKMRYLPAEEGWGNAQQVRLVWMVQALVDVCEKYKDGRCVKYEEMNRTQIIHTYGDEWFLTGLDVREDHGVDFAVIYEDPAVDDDLDDDSLLLYLTYGLDKTFLAGSDCEDLDDKGTSDPNDDECIAGDGQRDITIAEIYRRWNHATNGTISDVQRWSLDNHLSVVTHTYETLDEGVATLAMTDTKQILDDHFTAYTPVTPTLLFAREERFRGANLDQSLDEDSGVVQWSTENPRRLTMRLAEDETPLETVAGLNWAPYRYQDGEWEAYPIEEYWDELHDRYTAAFANEYNDADDPEAARGGAVIVGQMYYLTLYVGVSQVVQSGDDLLIQEQVQSGDTPIWASIADFVKAAVLFVVNEVIMSNFEDATSAMKALYHTIKQLKPSTVREAASTAWRGLKNVRQWWAGFKARLGAIAMTTLVTLALVVTAISFLFRSYLNHHPAVRVTTAILVGVGLFVGTVVQPILQTIRQIGAWASEGLSTLAATGKVLRTSSKLIGVSKAIGIIGTIISIAIAWGIFIYTVITEDVPVNSVTFDIYLAQTIAATILAILTLALSLTIIGTIIVAIITVIDTVLSLLGFDWTITGWVTDAIAKAIFSYEPVIDVYDEDLVAMGGLDTALVRPGDGMVDGAELEFSTILTTTITHRNPRNWRTRAYLWMYDEDQLRSTTFKYELSSRKVPLSAKLGEMSDDWDIERDHKFLGRQMYTGWKSDSLSTITTLQAGIDSEANLKLTTAWAVPTMDCWSLWPLSIPICYEKGMIDSKSQTVGPVVLDVLPRTLDEFVDVASWADEMAFRDADGDGLLAQSYGGNDPDDTTWDTDGDGLSDAWELDMSAKPADEGGQFFDPRNPDTDGDGLDDGQEARLGTNPNNADTDGDGLTDAAEAIDGWTFTYAEGKSLHIYSDPLTADGDGDGMDDLFERTLHTCPGCDPLENRYHPAVWNTSPIGLYTETDDTDGVVRPTQTFAYTTTVANNLKPDLWVRGETTLDPASFTGGPLDMSFDIARDQSQALYADITVPADAVEGDVDLTTSLQAQLHTPSVWAWDPERAGDRDTASGHQPNAVAVTAVDGWSVPYLVVTRDAYDVYAYPATADGISDSGVLLGDNASNVGLDVACNDAGICLAVWSSGDALNWQRLAPTMQVMGTVQTLSGTVVGPPAIATDGTDFRLVWYEGDSGDRTLYARTIHADGSPGGDALTLDSGAVGQADITYAFDRYQVVWEQSGDLFAAEIYGSQVTTYTISDDSAADSQPRIAYDPLSQRSLIAYHRETATDRHGWQARVFAGGHVGEPLTLEQIRSWSSDMPPAVSADPVNGGWVVAWRPKLGGRNVPLRYAAIGLNGELRGRKQFLDAGSYTSALAVACAEPRPVVQLLLDEDAGATTFADASGFGNDGTCTDDSRYDCPSAGDGGHEGNAVRFDGQNDEIHVVVDVSETDYAASLWFKTTDHNGGLLQVADDRPDIDYPRHDRDIYIENGRVCADLGLGWLHNPRKGEDIICTPEAGYDDGAWHFVVHTFGGSVGEQRLYVDGELRAIGHRSSSNFIVQTKVRIGTTDHIGGSDETLYFAGLIDQVTLYSRALSAGEVRDAYRTALLVYPFDEAEGATTFSDAAHNGYGATCSGDGCPTSGVAGRAYAALAFDGRDDVLQAAEPDTSPLANRSFTIAFWAMRYTDGEDYVLAQGQRSTDQGLHVGFRPSGRFTCAFYGDDLDTDAAYNDHRWHHWACTYDADTNLRTIYRDGQQVAQDTASADYQGSGPFLIGRGLWDGARAFRGRLDELAIWRDALTADEIETLYHKVKALDDSVTECVLPYADRGVATLHFDRLAVRETTTFLGKAERNTTDTFTVDRTEPDTTITSLADGAVLNITGTLVIGGEARDNTFVAQVEVSVDGGPWEEAEGAETWTYAWDTSALGEGSHTIQARAIDAGGNVETTVASVTVDIDRTPATLTVTSHPQKATQDGDGNWLVSLSGSVTDVYPDTVEVLLQGQGDAAAGFGWQQATVVGSSWSLDYRLSNMDNDGDALANPTGVYTVSLRATDLPGNQTPEAAYLTVNLDNTPPETALTFPYTDTVVLTDTTRLITGIVTDTGSVAYGVAGVEIAFVNSEEVSPTITWHDALLTNPGAITSTWAYTTPADMEGFYEIYVRGTDVLGNRNDYPSTWVLWRGMVDTRDPYVDALADYGVMGTVPPLTPGSVITYTEITCQARDLTLDITRFSGCPCDPSVWQITTYDQVSPWYRNTFSDTTRIYQVDARCLWPGEFTTPPTVHAYDAIGHHSQTVLSETVSVRLLDSAVLTPTYGTVLTTTDPFDVEGYAVAIPWGIGPITVTVNGAVWRQYNYSGAMLHDWGDTFDPAAYNPPGDGRYRFLSIVREWNNPDGNREQTVLHPITVTVDSLPPSTPTFTTTVFTTAHRAEEWPVFLTGVVTDLVGLDRVETNRDGEGWVRAAYDGTTWRARWTHDDSQSDNVAYTVSVRAVDLVSRTAQTTATITFDVVPPEPVTITMSAQDPQNPLLYHPLQPGQIVTDSHVLRLVWTPSSDGAGVRGYYYGWTTSPTATAGLSYTVHSGAPSYAATGVISEAQTVYGRVVPVDNHGNRQEQAEGPVYVDSPLTPDIVDLDYHGWMESGCTLMGVDRRVETHAFDGAALSEPQRFYATWDDTALRMAWEGANWDYEGDLFIYFDTAPGGATTLYNPYTATMTNTTIYLPGNVPSVDTSAWPEFAQVHYTQLISPLLSVAMQADTLLWVQSTLTATLLHWNGSAWGSPTQLTADEYHWDDGLSDFYLPFSALGITQPAISSLNLLAVATEGDALRLWATMPDRNLVDSSLVVNPTAAQGQEHVFVLTHPYRWSSLGSGICPNDPLSALTGETFPDSDLQVHLSVEPAGTTYALMGDDLYHQWQALYQGEGPEQRQFDFLDHSHRPVGDGDVITYTLQVENRGPVTAAGVRALVSAYYALSLPGGTQDPAGYREYRVIDLGDVAPGATVTATFTGIVNANTNWRYTQCLAVNPSELCRPLREWAVLEGMVFDERSPLTLTLGLPTEPPQEWLWADHQVDADPPEQVRIDGSLAVVKPLTNTISGYAYDPSGVPLIEVQVRDPLSVTTTFVCTDDTPTDGRWSCPWVVNGSDGDEFDLRVRATDGYGHVSDWTSPWRTVVLDSTPPTVTLDLEAQEAVGGQLIGPDGYLLTGRFTDTHSLGAVQVCRDVDGETTCDPATTVLSTQAPTTTERLYDDAPGAPMAIGATCLTRTFTVGDDFYAADVNLGFAAAIANREELMVDLFSPSGTGVRVIGGVVSYTAYADYDVWLDDAAPGELHNSADDDVAEPYFDRAARPDERLSLFNGEPVSGTWTLRICDRLPLVNPGYYHRARLSLTPQSSALSSAGTWAYALPTLAGMDGVTQTLTIYGLDELGNRVDTPLYLTYTLDTVAPALSVTSSVDHLALLDAPHQPVLAGQVSDGGGVEAVYLRVDPPDGASYRDVAASDGSAWQYTLRSAQAGTYTLWVEAYDLAGNVRVDGPYRVTVDYTPVQSVEISGPTRALTGTLVTLQATYTPIDATGVELVWHDGQTGDSATYVWPEGIYTAVVTATDVGDNVVTATHTVTVVCPVVQSAHIEGPTTVLTGTPVVLYGSYTATDDITGGVTLEWDNGTVGASAVYTWTEVGTYTVVLTATGACGAPVTATHAVSVTDTMPHWIYLPLIMRSAVGLSAGASPPGDGFGPK